KMFVGQSSFLLEIVSKMMYITMHAAIIPSNFTTMASNQSVVFKCCSVFTVNETLVANCSNLNWTFVHLRCVPVTTEVLLLDRNNLTTLTNGSFQALTSLRQLSLQTSNIHRIEIDTFLGLSLLQTLNLENNKLSDIGNSFNPQTFRHLRNLRQLFIGNNQNFSKSLGKAFIYLHNLSLLSMDSSATLHVGSEFSNLTQLNNLTLNCSIVTSITNESFVGLWSSKLTILNLISFNKLKYDPDDFDKVTSQKQFSDDAFQNLNSLEVLRIIKCRIGNKNMARKIKHFINSSLHTLYLEATHYKRGFYTPNSTLEDGVIFKSTAKYLSQLTLTHVSWIDSNIFAIEPGVISSPQWRHNLRIADFSKNQMGWLGWRSPLLEASRLEKLEELTITAPSPESEVSYFYDGLDFYKRNVQPTGTTQTMKTYDSKDNNSRNNALFINATVSQMSAKKNNDSEKIKFFNKEENLALEPIALSPNTSYVELDSISEQSLFQLSDNPPYPIDSGTWTVRMSHSLRIIKIMYLLHGDNNVGNQSVQFIQTPREAANVTHFYFVGNSVFRGTGRMMGLTNLQLFDLSKNSLSVAPYFFDDFPSLKYLILQSTKNENFFQHISIDRIIQNMPELRYLDLTDNKLNFLPPNLFSRNSHITHVILAKNRFSSFPITMDLVPNLKTLDLTGNAIIYLTEEEMTFLTKHSENVPDFSLLLAENNIACVCSQIKFL
ncbi:toll-like receptor 4, partial [Biomphalaria pfeifferi]